MQQSIWCRLPQINRNRIWFETTKCNLQSLHAHVQQKKIQDTACNSGLACKQTDPRRIPSFFKLRAKCVWKCGSKCGSKCTQNTLCNAVYENAAFSMHQWWLSAACACNWDFTEHLSLILHQFGECAHFAQCASSYLSCGWGRSKKQPNFCVAAIIIIWR